MGYRSDIRFLATLEDYTKLKSDCQVKCGEDSYFYVLDREEIRTSDNGKQFMYFGWDGIKWYTELNEPEYRELDDIEEMLCESEEYQKIRIGEDYSDIEAVWNLTDSSVCIEIIRAFDEQNKENK